MKKIVLVASYPESIIDFRLPLMKEFLTRKYTVIVVAPYNEKIMLDLARNGIKYNPIPLDRNGQNPLKDLFFLVKLYFFLRKEQPDIVMSYTTKPVIYASIAAKLAKIPGIYAMITGTGYIFAKYNLKNRIIGFISQKMFKFFLPFNKKLFFQNKDNVNFFIQQNLIKSKQKIAIINGSGVDLNLFKQASLPKQISFLMIARLIYDKGIREYIAAAYKIKKLYPHIHFRLVGWIDTNPNSITQQELDQWIESGVIEYLGKLADVRGAIAASSVYVLPSYGEGTPRSVLEAMAMGRPIITTDAPGCKETVVNGKNGYIVKVGNVSELCDAMEYFIQHPQALPQMGKKSRQLAVEKYDVNKVNNCILEEIGILV